MPKLSIKIKTYIAMICIIAALVLIYLLNIHSIPSINVLVFWSILAIIAESLLIELPSGAGISVGFAIGLASLITGGPLLASIVTATSFIFRIVKTSDNKFIHLFNVPFYKTIFNVAQSIIVAGISGMIYKYIYNYSSPEKQGISFIAIFSTLVVYMFLNTLIVSRLFSFILNKSFFKMWMNYLKIMFPSSLAVAALGIIIALSYLGYGFGAVLLFFGPLLLARYSFKMYLDLRHVYMESIQVLTKTIEAKDSYTQGHTLRVQEYALKLAKAIDLTEKQIENVKTAALLHDIGKIGIDDNILKKPDKLTEDEYKLIQKHPLIGVEILKDVDFLKDVINIIKYHHERYDGKGYPEGIMGEDIPIEALILSIADVFDAMTSDRPYRNALPIEIALSEIENSAGKQLHPKLSKVFVQLIRNEIEGEKLANVH